MTEKTARKHIKNSDEPDRYSWVDIDLFPDGRGWKCWPYYNGAKKMRLSDLPIGTLFEFDTLSTIYKVIKQKEDGVIVEIIDNQEDQFPKTIGETKEFENYYYGKYGRTVRRPKYICLPENSEVDEEVAKKAQKANEKIHQEWDKKDEDEILSAMIGDCFNQINDALDGSDE